MERIDKKWIIIFLMLISFRQYAQEKRDFIYYDQTTYAQYLNGDWVNLINTGIEALKNDFDYYYLRTRMGIAFYETGSYSSAVRHFEKALKFNSSDPVILEYLYYSYIFIARYPDASRLFYKYQELLKDRITDYRPRLFDGLSLEGGMKFSDHTTLQGTEVGTIYYGQLGLSNNIRGRLYIFQYIGSLNLGLQDWFTGQNNILYRVPYSINQVDYYLQTGIFLRKGWMISPAFHYIYVDAVTSSYTDIFGSVGIHKHYGKIKAGLSWSYSEIIDTRFSQLTPTIIFYPLGNTKLYLKGTASFTSGDLTQKIAGGMAGFKIINLTWLEGFYHSGRSQYASFNEGYIIYNTSDYLLSRAGLIITHFWNNKNSFSVSFQLENKEQAVSEDVYSHHFLFFGLNFKF
jgi:tetratricopeptide (TPR) repeat protein